MLHAQEPALGCDQEQGRRKPERSEVEKDEGSEDEAHRKNCPRHALVTLFKEYQ